MYEELMLELNDLFLEIETISDSVSEWVEWANNNHPEDGPVEWFLKDSGMWMGDLRTWLIHAESCDETASRLPRFLLRDYSYERTDKCYIIHDGLTAAIQLIITAINELEKARTEVMEYAQAMDLGEKLLEIDVESILEDYADADAEGEEASGIDYSSIKDLIPAELHTVFDKWFTGDYDEYMEKVSDYYWNDYPQHEADILALIQRAEEIVQQLTDM